MEQGNDATLNNNETGGSSVPVERGGLVSTVEFTSKTPAADADPEGANNTEGTDPDGSKKAGQEDAGKKAEGDGELKDGQKETPSGDDDRFDKHPRFVELRTRAENAEAKVGSLEKRLDALENTRTPTGKEGGDELPFKDVSKMSAEELLDWQSDNPHEFYQNAVAQAKHEMGKDFDKRMEKKSGEDAVVETYENFAKNNPDFDEMWDKGTLQAFMERNPGHNAISAYYVLTSDSKLKDAIDKAVADAEKKFTANQKAKRENQSLGGGPQTTGTKDMPVDAELQDTKKFGGSIRVMANRLKARRTQAGL